MANLPQFSLWNTCSPVICSLWFILCNKGTLNRRSLFRQNSSSRKRAQKNVPIMVPSARKAGLRRCSSLSQHAEKCIRNFSGHPSFSHINFIYFVLILHPSLHWTLAPSHSPDNILPQLFLTFTFWISTPACSHYGEHYSEQGLQHVRAPACSSVCAHPSCSSGELRLLSSPLVSPCTGQFLGAAWRLITTNPLRNYWSLLVSQAWSSNFTALHSWSREQGWGLSREGCSKHQHKLVTLESADVRGFVVLAHKSFVRITGVGELGHGPVVRHTGCESGALGDVPQPLGDSLWARANSKSLLCVSDPVTNWNSKSGTPCEKGTNPHSY